MSDSILGSGSDLAAEQSGSNQNLDVIRNPLLAGFCAVICVFTSIAAFFFAGWFPLSSDREIACWISIVIFESRVIVDDVIILNLFVLSTACFAGYLFTGALNKRVGIIPLLIAGFFGFLYLITMLPTFTGVFFLPPILYELRYIPYFVWFFLSMIVMPIIYLIGTLKAKTIPAWKTSVLIIAPFFVFAFLFLSILMVGINAQGKTFVLSRGMAFWILFAVVIFSELIRTKVKKLYIWLTLIFSMSAAVLSVIVSLAIYFMLYQSAIEYRKATLNRGKSDPCSYVRNF